jgi:hypothetical protein
MSNYFPDLDQMRSRNRYYKKMNEILYVLYAGKELGWKHVSKIGVQKLIYLSEVLAPLKEIILSFLNFIYHRKGPYSSDVQNILDHLVALDAIKVVSFEQYGKSAFVNYEISETGEYLVKNLIFDNVEKEKFNWIRLALKIVDAYKDIFEIGQHFKNIDKIIDLVYQEPSFKEIQKKGRGTFIPIGYEDNPAVKLLEFLKTVEKEEIPLLFKRNPQEDLETILLMFFEYLYVEFLSSRREKNARE